MEDKIEKKAQNIFDQNTNKQQFSVTPISFHTHNGTDSQKLKQENIINGALSIISAESISSEIIIINLLQNINVLTLHAIAANGLGQKASINGTAQLGKCYLYNWAGDTTIVPVTKGRYQTFLQSCSSTYLDAVDTTTTIGGITVVTSSGATNTKVYATGDSVKGGPGYISYVADNTGTVVASMQIIEWTGTSIKINTHLEANWYIKWFLSMS